MARETARRVGPRGAGPNSLGRDREARPQDFIHTPALHTPGPLCGACTVRRCNQDGCEGHVHQIYSDGSRFCDSHGRVS